MPTFSLTSLSATVSGSTLTASASAKVTDSNARDIDTYAIVATAASGKVTTIVSKSNVDFWKNTNVSLSGSASVTDGVYTVQVIAQEGSTRYAIGAPKTVTVGTAPAPDPEPTPPPAAGRLRWAPPALSNPVTVQVTDANKSMKLDKTKDYVLVLPKAARLKGTLSVYGGHHVVVIGGSIDASGTRAAYFQNQTGDLHFEGVDFYADADNALHEGMDLSWPENPGVEQNITFQNCTSSTSNGSYGTYHSDWLQIWNISNPKTNLRISNCDVKTGYQGLMLQPKQYGDFTFQRVEMHDFVIRKTQASGYCIFCAGTATPSACPWVVTGSTLVTTTGSNKGQGFYPESLTPAGFTVAKDAPTTIIGTPGVDYVSPGYSA